MMNTNPSTDSHKTGGRRGLAVGLAGGLLAGTAAGLVFGVPGLTSAASDAVPAVLVQQTDETDTTTEGRSRRDWALACASRCRNSSTPAPSPPNRPTPSPHISSRTAPNAASSARVTGPVAIAADRHVRTWRRIRGADRPARHRGEELRTQVRDGATLAEIATAQGVEVQAVIDELVAELDRAGRTTPSRTAASTRPRPTRSSPTPRRRSPTWSTTVAPSAAPPTPRTDPTKRRRTRVPGTSCTSPPVCAFRQL